jgi:hypothetical protein
MNDVDLKIGVVRIRQALKTEALGQLQGGAALRPPTTLLVCRGERLPVTGHRP